MKTYKTLHSFGSDEYIVEKSTFIGYAKPIKSEEEAVEFINEIKKKHKDATHNVWAYTVGETMNIQRYSDDGEPQGTAGKPMLDVLLGEELYNIAVVVTRYFGGTLLGTGGLVRAYSKAVQEGLKNSILITKNHGVCLLVGTDYNGVGKLQYLFGQENLPILDSRYTESVEFEVLVPKKEEERIKKAVTEATSGKASVTAEKELYYAILDKEVLTFED